MKKYRIEVMATYIKKCKTEEEAFQAVKKFWVDKFKNDLEKFLESTLVIYNK